MPTNLIAYSVGGEKTYKTGESLLFTPLCVITNNITRPQIMA